MLYLSHRNRSQDSRMKVSIGKQINDTMVISVNNLPKPIIISLVREEHDETQHTWIQYAEIFHELMTSGEASFFADESIDWLQENNDFSPLKISLHCDENDYTQLSNYIDDLPALDVIRADLQTKLEALKDMPSYLSKPYSVWCKYSGAKIKADFVSRIEPIENKIDDVWKRSFFVKKCFPDKIFVYEQFGKPETLSN